MKAISLIIGVCIVIGLFGSVMAGLLSFRSTEYTEPHVVTTGAGVTSASVVLTQSLFDDSTAFVTITSNNTGDAAVPSSYTSATRTLLVGGLLESTAHYLTITYSYGSLGSYWASDISSRAVPVLLIIGVIGVIGGAVYGSYRRNEE
ncbi:MAG: hypothetical protein PHG35_01945 [Dehalococcoidales bacterium]|nr:hypothetical protein [Dehalococcoidales bacterium]